MMTSLRLLNMALVVVLAGCAQPQDPVGEMSFPEGSVQHVVRAGEIQWKPTPPNLPPGSEMAVLEGDPRGNALFTVRFRTYTDMIVPAHSHPVNERVTVLQGRAAVAFGPDATRETGTEFGPGDYYVNAHGAVHTIWLDSATILQITGIGPWTLDFVDP